MAQARITCWQCPTYDREVRRCRIGKTNPETKHESITVAEVLGVRALCVHNPYREPLLLRMYAPNRRFVWAAAPLRLAAAHIEVEIIEEEEE